MASLLPQQALRRHVSRRKPGWAPVSAVAGMTVALIVCSVVFVLVLGSATERLKYCHTTSGYIISLFSWGTSALAGKQRTGVSNREQRQLYPLELPFATDDAVRKQCMRDMQDLLLARVRGQPQVVMPLLDVLRRKLAYPREPVVVHLAGDNGVGKTHTARLVSQALSLRCAPDRDVCDAGDNLLTIAGTGFDGLSVAEARQRIIGQIITHTDRYPHGVVLIDDLTAMDPSLVSALAPLFGRAAHFPEQLTHPSTATAAGARHAAAKSLQTMHDSSLSSGQPPPPLSQLIIFVTTDFGRQGRTVGKSRTEIEAMIQHDFADLYGTLLPAYTRTFVYYPFTSAMAEDVVRSAVTDLPCALGERLIASSTISDEAVSFLVQQHRQLWSGKENGHALRRLVEDEIVSQLVVYWETHAQQKHFERLRVHFELDEASMRVLLRTPHTSRTTASQPPAALSSVEARAYGHGGADDGDGEERSDL
ncbi:ATPase associated with various cellular activities (AAA) family protein [Leishmania donovani]|uniref:ATPase associated with various cellular activities (AAA) family protein n=1 Tax=Leishmania donovani TaxID=5661 RepID=A0A504X412_LEIDO|nr:ATPase associated with various cellular activities (AAA) family protein [Leishmania donovani]